MNAIDVYRQLEERVNKARMELSLASVQYRPESMEVEQAKAKKALAEQEFVDFRACWDDVA